MSSPSGSINEMDDSSVNKKRGRAHSVEPVTPQEIDNESNTSQETSSVTVSAPKKTKRDDEDNSTSISTIRKNMKDMSTTDKNLTDNHSTATSESHDDETMSHSSEENEAEEEKETSEKDEEMKQEAKTNVEVKDEDKESNKEKTITSDPFTKFGGNGKEDDWGEFAEDDNSQQKTKVDVKTKDTESENGKSKYTFGASSGFGSKGWAAANQTVPISSKPLFGGFGNTSSFGFKSLGSTTTTTTTTTTNAFTSTNDNLSDKKTSTPSWGSFVNATASPFAAIAASAGNALASSPADKSDSTSKNANITVSNMNTNTEKQTELDGEKDETSASISTFGEGPKVKVPGIKQQTKVKTGEEDEDTVYQTRAKLFTLDTASGNWKERGVGIFRINVKDEDEEKGMQARLVMRTDSVYRLILNLLLFEGMKVFIMQDKFVRFAGFESETKEDGTVETKLINFALKLKDATLANEVCEQISSYVPSSSKA